MKKYIPEVDAFEFKAKLIARKLKQFAVDYKKDYMDIKILSDFLAIEPKEMNSMVYYLKRGEFIETDTEKSHIKLTEYGSMVYCDNNNGGFAPIIC